ncbi:MAG: hypothetical protein C4295_09800 [Candidatus Fervidibacterota bacterium]
MRSNCRLSAPGGQFLAEGQVVFLLPPGICQRAVWQVGGEGEGALIPPQKDALPLSFRLRFFAN